jgi:hypothetical protein
VPLQALAYVGTWLGDAVTTRLPRTKGVMVAVDVTTAVEKVVSVTVATVVSDSVVKGYIVVITETVEAVTVRVVVEGKTVVYAVLVTVEG